MAPQVATIFVQKEVDNIFMLSGGLSIISAHSALECSPIPLPHISCHFNHSSTNFLFSHHVWRVNTLTLACLSPPSLFLPRSISLSPTHHTPVLCIRMVICCRLPGSVSYDLMKVFMSWSRNRERHEICLVEISYICKRYVTRNSHME